MSCATDGFSAITKVFELTDDFVVPRGTPTSKYSYNPHSSRVRTRTRARVHIQINRVLAMAEKAVNGGADALVPESSERASGRRIQVRRSGVHGKGVFALRDIAEGETIIEYVGEITDSEKQSFYEDAIALLFPIR